MRQQLKIRLFADGTTQAETMGIKGQKCLDFIPLLEALLGAEVLASEFTDEYHQQDVVQDVQQQHTVIEQRD